jgi:hypothetical protein
LHWPSLLPTPALRDTYLEYLQIWPGHLYGTRVFCPLILSFFSHLRMLSICPLTRLFYIITLTETITWTCFKMYIVGVSPILARSLIWHNGILSTYLSFFSHLSMLSVCPLAKLFYIITLTEAITGTCFKRYLVGISPNLARSLIRHNSILSTHLVIY